MSKPKETFEQQIANFMNDVYLNKVDLSENALLDEVEDELPPRPNPYIICAAVHFPNGKKYSDQPINIESGYVVAGRRHSNCYKTLEIIGVNIGECERKDEGFLTSDNRFLNRAEAAILAKERGQLLVNYTPEILISENLYYP